MDAFAEVSLVTDKNGRTYRLTIPWAAPFSELYEVIDQFRAQAKLMEESQLQQAADRGSEKIRES